MRRSPGPPVAIPARARAALAACRGLGRRLHRTPSSPAKACRGSRAAWHTGFALAVGLAATACGPPPETRPNLLLVTVDSLRPEFLACYGGAPSVGREMCSLAEGGVQYTWALSASPNSAPAVASILTSTYPSLHGVGRSAATFLRSGAKTLPSVLQRQGYATAAFVGSPELNRSRNLQQGFDRYDDRGADVDPRHGPERRAEELTDATLAWLAVAPEPWFVWVHYRDPHGPYDAPVDTASASIPPPDPAPGSGERLRVLPPSIDRGGIPAYQAIPGLFTREAYEVRYRAEIRYVDGQLGRVLAHLREHAGPVGIVLTADHGEAFGEDRYWFTHGHSVALDQVRVPLFWRPHRSGAPGAAAGSETIGVPVSTLDVAPTLLRAAGLSAPGSFHGRPLPAATDVVGAPQLARAIFAETEERVAVVVGSNYYARDRAPDEPFLAGGLTSRALARANARTARLRATDAAGTPVVLPEYQRARAAGAAEVLEPRLAAFLAGGTSGENGGGD